MNRGMRSVNVLFRSKNARIRKEFYFFAAKYFAEPWYPKITPWKSKTNFAAKSQRNSSRNRGEKFVSWKSAFTDAFEDDHVARMVYKQSHVAHVELSAPFCTKQLYLLYLLFASCVPFTAPLGWTCKKTFWFREHSLITLIFVGCACTLNWPLGPRFRFFNADSRFEADFDLNDRPSLGWNMGRLKHSICATSVKCRMSINWNGNKAL